MSQFEKLKNKLCLKVCIKSKKTPDYEYVGYEKTTNTKCESIVQETQTVIKHSAHKPVKAENPKFQSTRIEQSTFNSFYTTAISQNNNSTHVNKITSTLLQSVHPFQTEDKEPELSQIEEENEVSKAFSNQYYTSPILSRSIPSSDSSLSFTSVAYSDPTVYESTNDIFADSQSFECESAQFKSATSSMFNSCNQLNQSTDQLHVCIIAYQAKFEGDLSLKFAERVKVLHCVNNDYVLVKNISTKQCGYVPVEHLSTLNDFLAEIARNCHNL